MSEAEAERIARDVVEEYISDSEEDEPLKPLASSSSSWSLQETVELNEKINTWLTCCKRDEVEDDLEAPLASVEKETDI